MLSALENIIATLLHVEIILGILGNGFITLVNCIDWFKKRKLSWTDGILTALAIARLFLILTMMVRFMMDFYVVLHLSSQKIILITIAVTIGNHFSVWLAAGLSIFYFFKIVNFSNPVFIYLKHRVEMVVLVTMLAALVFLPFILAMTSRYLSIRIQSDGKNMTLSSKWNDNEKFVKLILFIVEAFVPFFISLKFLLLLVFFLWKHLMNVKTSTTKFRNSSLKIHVTALKIMTSFFFLFATYFLTCLVTTFYHEELKNKLVLMLVLTIANACPSVHSWILILGSHKLRKASLCLM
ncbi:taste receptor type 2 member 14-like [Sorex araneus]|uniref:taste receptor type 2 member 14-like n=1 Tax=Sorex araneus TaxID=42254 RepID=UPI0024339BB3|nr:taste receptor type 2 member 14-like [Sorex araneus]